MEQVIEMTKKEITELETKRDEFLRAVVQEQELRLEYALRFMIPHPIKGEITPQKCKWRGLTYKVTRLDHIGKLFDGRILVLPSKSGKRKEFTINMQEIGENEEYKKWKQQIKRNELI